MLYGNQSTIRPHLQLWYQQVFLYLIFFCSSSSVEDFYFICFSQLRIAICHVGIMKTIFRIYWHWVASETELIHFLLERLPLFVTLPGVINDTSVWHSAGLSLAANIGNLLNLHSHLGAFLQKQLQKFLFVLKSCIERPWNASIIHLKQIIVEDKRAFVDPKCTSPFMPQIYLYLRVRGSSVYIYCHIRCILGDVAEDESQREG